MQPAPNIFNVAPGRPFLEALAQAILAGDLPSPGGARPDLLDLPAITILLPTRRAARALQSAFLKAGSGRAMLLPAIRPISETAEDQSLIESFSFALEQGPLAADLPPAIGKLERQLVLTRLVMAWSGSMRRGEDDAEADLAPVVAAGAGTPAQAAHLAHELASLMDAVATENVALDQLTAVVDTLREMGVSIVGEGGQNRPESGLGDGAACRVSVPHPLRPVDCHALPYPGFPTDVQAQLTALLCLTPGQSTVTDQVFPSRFMHVSELLRMGADIRREGDSGVITGVSQLSGAHVMASDLRASAALVLAALAARGETTIHRIYHLDRGYEQLEIKLQSLGARVSRVAGEDD